MHTGLARYTTHSPGLATIGLSLALAACGGPSGPVDGARAMAHVEALVEIGSRPFGSDELAKAADYITGQLEQLGLKPQRQEVEHPREKKTIRNLYVQIDGEDPDNGPILIVGAHYDTKATAGHQEWTHELPFVGAIDGGGGPAVLLELARVLHGREQKPRCNIWLYWIDAEESIDWVWNDERALLGSEAFCDWLSKSGTLKRVKAFVLLDLIGSENFKIDRDGNSSTKLLDLFAEAAKEMGAERRLYEYPTAAEVQAARQQGINWGTKDDHLNFINRGIPSVLLIDFSQRIPGQPENELYEQWWHTPDDNLEAMDPDSLAFAGNLVMQALPRLETFVLGKK